MGGERTGGGMAIGMMLITNALVEKYGFRMALAHVQDVSGGWHGQNSDRDGSIMRERIQIVQKGSRLTGELHYEYVETGKPTARMKKFVLRGILRNDVVSLYYYNADRREKGSGAICLRVADDGHALVGKWAWWDTKLEAVESSLPTETLIWTRSPPSQSPLQSATPNQQAAPLSKR